MLLKSHILLDIQAAVSRNFHLQLVGFKEASYCALENKMHPAQPAVLW